MGRDTQQPWQLIRSEQGPDLTLFRARFDWMENPRNGRSVKAVVLEAPEWVNVVAVTPQGKFIVVRQYRFGVGRPTTEIPAGIVEPGEASQQAAMRELQEETGYTATDWEYLGYTEPNPAFLNNLCHQWLARNVTRTHLPALDEGEDIWVGEMSEEELRQEIEAGRLRHCLALVALSHVIRLWDDGE